MARLRKGAAVALSLLLSMSLVVAEVRGAPPAGMAMVVSAHQAYVGTAEASAGTTIFAGDQLNTEETGSLQLRAGAARLLLTAKSGITWGIEAGMPQVTLTRGGAVFSTAGARALALKAGTAILRPQADQPTVGNVTILGPKELVVRCSRGALTIAVDDDIRVIPEGTAYRVVLDAEAPLRAGDPPPSPASWGNNRPIHPGKSKFLWYAIGVTALVTWYAVSEALESPDKP
jgi:ferric-dicitrate binding protein FerR (iron transport regulator)